MKKTLIRALSVFLCLVMMVGAVPLNAFAQTEQILDADSSSEFGTQSALDIIASNLASGTANEKFAISYLEMVGTKAYVEIGNVEECRVIVAVYDEETMQMIASGIADVPVEHGSIEVNINIQSMPEYYVVKAYLVNENNAPLCEAYTSLMYTTAYVEFLEKEPEDFKSSEVIVFDGEKEQTDFGVLVDGAVVTENSAEMTFIFDSENSKYYFYNATDDVKKLTPGDVYYYEYGTESNEFLLFKVKESSVNGSTVIVVPDDNVSLEDVFSFIRIDASGDYDEIELDEDELGEALKVIDDSSTKGTISTQGDPEFDYDTGEETWGTTLGVEWEPSDNLSISGELGYEFSTSVKLIYDVVLFGKDYYEFKSETNHKISLIGFKVTGKIELDTDVVKIPIPPIPVGPFTLNIKVAPLFSLSASIGFDINYNIKTIVTADKENGMQKTQSSESDWDAELKDEIEIKLGIEIEFKLSFTGIVSLALNGTGGLKFTGESTTVGAWVDELHDCIACVEGEVCAFIEVKLTLEIDLGILELSWDAVKWTKEWPLFDFYISLNTKGFSCGRGQCHNKFHKATFVVWLSEDGGNKYIEGATVSTSTGVCDSNKDGKYDETEMITNSNGEAALYFKPGEHSVTVSYEDYASITKNFKIIENETKKVSIELKTEEKPDDEENDIVTPGTVSSKFSSSTGTLTISGTGVMDNYTGFGQAPWDSYKDSIEHIVIESGVTGLGDYAFAQCRNLETVTFSDTVKEIGTATFYECNALQTITLPNSVETVDDYAFYNCYSMTTASLGSVETIGMYSFAQCTALKTVTIPATTTSVGDSAFAWCQGMNGIVFLNKNCKIYQSANTIYTDTTIYGSIGSTAQKYANTYGRKFSSVTTASVVDTTRIYDSYAFTCSSCVAGSDYILLNVTGYGNGFELSTSNLEFIDQYTADSTGVVSESFIPRKFVSGSATLLIGDFGNGIEVKKITPKLVSTSVEIDNNPQTLTINYRESLKLTASVISPVEGSSIVWYVDGEYYCSGDTFEYSEVKSGMTVTAKLVDVNGNPIMKNGEEISSEETIKVNAGFFQKIIAFFKFTLFRKVVVRTN